MKTIAVLFFVVAIVAGCATTPSPTQYAILQATVPGYSTAVAINEGRDRASQKAIRITPAGEALDGALVGFDLATIFDGIEEAGPEMVTSILADILKALVWYLFYDSELKGEEIP